MTSDNAGGQRSMSGVRSVLVLLRDGVVRTFAAAIRSLFLLLALIPLLIAWLWRCLKACKDGWRDQDEEQKDCHLPFPEDLMRRPDPCIYSQFYLLAQNLPVTWDNPDIWLARAATPNVIEPDSYHLAEDTDYIVFVRVHNASSDLALGVRTRLVYRPWSFNSPDLVPVETDAGGNEVFRTINVAPMGSTITTFRWRTPKVGPGSAHYCLQAILSHPMDVNTGNNLGQENTQVLDTDGTSARVVVPLHNPAGEARRFTIAATNYAVERKETVELRLKYNRGRRRQTAVDRVAAFVPAPTRGGTTVQNASFRLPGLVWAPERPIVKTKYTGMENLRDRLQKQDVSLPAGFGFVITDYHDGITLGPKETRDVEIFLTPPPGAAPGQRYSINVTARTQSGRIAGGATVLLTKRS